MSQSTLHAPEDQSGVVLGAQVMLGRSDTAAVVLHTLVGFPSGLLVSLGLHLRVSLEGRRWARELHEEDQPQRFRLGFGYDEPPEPVPFRTERDGSKPAWYLDGASGSDVAYTARLWVTPYPPAEVLTVSCAWEAQGIAVTSTRLTVPMVEQVVGETMKFWD